MEVDSQRSRKLGISFSDFLRSFVGHWFTGMSGALSVLLAIIAFFVTARTYSVLFAVVAVICVAASSFLVWRDERKARLEAEHGADRNNQKLEWEKLKSKFESGYQADLHAMWSRIKSEPIEWFTWGGRDEIERDEFCVLMEEAGNLLLKSQYFRSTFPQIISQADPEDRWLNAVCAVRSLPMEPTGKSISGGVESEHGQIKELPRIFALVCAQLAAKESW
jgi:hypothetical protein